jgi:alpha-tubulin suppressor-like RCC1 family protein
MNLQSSYSSVGRGAIFITEDDQLYVWGSNESHTLGLVSPANIREPLLLDTPKFKTTTGKPTQWLSLSGGEYHMLALTKDGRLFGWGSNTLGQLGFPAVDDQTFAPPKRIPLSFLEDPQDRLVQVACGAYFSFVRTLHGQLYAWGENGDGQLGLGKTGLHNTPSKVPPLPSPVIDIACGWFHTLVLTEEGELYACGRNEDGKLGVGDQDSRSSFTLVNLQNVSKVFAGAHQSFALTHSGALWGWGWNPDGALCTGEKGTDYWTPTLLIPSGVRGLGSGWTFTVVLLEDGCVYSWGYNTYGQLGIGDSRDRSTREKVIFPEPAPKNFAAVGAAQYYSWALDEGGSLWLWGAHMDTGFQDTDILTPFLVPGYKWKIPKDTFWVEIYFWFFLGKSDQNSIFSLFPVEILYHAVTMTKFVNFALLP